MTNVILAIGVLVLAYLIGSINFAVLIGKIFFDDKLDKWVIEEYIVG